MKVRSLASRLRRSLREFPATVVLGLRQVGKTTLVAEASGRRLVTLDDIGALAAARRDPEGFLAGLPRPVTIDEVQRAPDLLLAVKRAVDQHRRPGEFLLTGSARIELGSGARETLAGRAALLRLRPMTWAEAADRPEWNPVDALFRARTVRAVLDAIPRAPRLAGDRVLAGGLPTAMLDRRPGRRRRWLDEFVATYVERDVPPLVRVEEVSRFLRFVSLVAARTAQTTNHAAVAKDIGVSADTGSRWMGVLEATFLVDLVLPWWRDARKRLVRSPKLHLGDAGVAASLVDASSWPVALRRQVGGPLLETLVAQHLLAFCESAARPTRLFHWRTHSGAEVDFVLERAGRLVPVEVKASSSPRLSEVRGLRAFLEAERTATVGVALHGGEDGYPLSARIAAVPLGGFLAGPE